MYVSPCGSYSCIADCVCTHHFEGPKYSKSVKTFPNDMDVIRGRIRAVVLGIRAVVSGIKAVVLGIRAVDGRKAMDVAGVAGGRCMLIN